MNLQLRLGAAIGMTLLAVTALLGHQLFGTSWSNHCDPGNAQFNLIKLDPIVSFHATHDVFTFESDSADNSWLCTNPTLSVSHIGDTSALYDELRAGLRASGWTELTPEFLPNQGFDVYLVDWGTPRPEDRTLTLESYVLDMLPACVAAVLAESAATEVSLFGYCMGGLLALLYAALQPAAPLRTLLTLATPVDFSKMGLQNFWSQPQFMDVDRLVDTFGNVPPELIAQSFRMLKPASEVSPVKYINLWQNVLNDKFVEQYRAFDQWTTDHIPFAGECFRQTTKEIVRENKFYKGTLEIGGRSAALSNITCSFLAVAAQNDHIVQLAATQVQPELVSSTDKELVVMPGGHVGLAAGRKAVQSLWPKVAGGLAERSQDVLLRPLLQSQLLERPQGLLARRAHVPDRRGVRPGPRSGDRAHLAGRPGYGVRDQAGRDPGCRRLSHHAAVAARAPEG